MSHNFFAVASTWQDVLIAFIAALPAMIAAWSSIKNGKKIDRHNGELGRQIDRLNRPRIGRN